MGRPARPPARICTVAAGRGTKCSMRNNAGSNLNAKSGMRPHMSATGSVQLRWRRNVYRWTKAFAMYCCPPAATTMPRLLVLPGCAAAAAAAAAGLAQRWMVLFMARTSPWKAASRMGRRYQQRYGPTCSRLGPWAWPLGGRASIAMACQCVDLAKL